MNREKLIAFAQGLIAGFKKSLAKAVELGVLTSQEAEAYTWVDMLAENTGIELESEADIERLADDELRQIRDAYI